MENENKFRTFLKENGIKQRWLADKLEVTEQTITNWVNGSNYPQIKYIELMKTIFRKESHIHFLGKNPNRE
tara:strand:+ start:1215 stop:1427 length:213 start_codon:yes stop_codon:yes gene_type:complete